MRPPAIFGLASGGCKSHLVRNGDAPDRDAWNDQMFHVRLSYELQSPETIAREGEDAVFCDLPDR